MQRDNKNYYGKKESLFEVSSRAKLGFTNLQHHGKLLKPETIKNFTKFASEDKQSQQEMLFDSADIYIDAFIDIVKNLNNDRDLMEFVLPTLDAIFTEERKVLRDVAENIENNSTKDPFLKSLRSFLYMAEHKPATCEAAVRILSILLGEMSGALEEQKNFLMDIISINKGDKKVKISDFCLVSSFVHLIKHEELGIAFTKNGGVEVVVEILNRNSNDLQIVYYSFLNIWLISFIEDAYATYLSVPKIGIIRLICEILQKISRDKLVRVAFFIFKNLQKNTQCLELMMDVGLLKLVDTLLKGNIKDKEIIDDIKAVGENLENNIKILSSFQKYVKELHAENLEWSAVHTERFWKENALRFEESDYQLIKKLHNMLLTSNREKNVAIACYDLGEFCRFYPHGRGVLESLKVKQTIMDKAKNSESKSIREQALLALQKIMIQNWQAI